MKAEILKLIPVAQVISGENVHETRTTKEIAAMLRISTAEAYKILCEMEAEGSSVKMGYRTKNGFEDIENSTRQTTSLTWQFYSK